MNNRDLAIQRNKVAHLCEFESSRHRNCVRPHPAESKKHWDTKCDLAWKYKNNKYITEAKFKTGGQADFLILDKGIVIEAVNSEKPESIEEKKVKYPDELEIQVVECKDGRGREYNYSVSKETIDVLERVIYCFRNPVTKERYVKASRDLGNLTRRMKGRL